MLTSSRARNSEIRSLADPPATARRRRRAGSVVLAAPAGRRPRPSTGARATPAGPAPPTRTKFVNAPPSSGDTVGDQRRPAAGQRSGAGRPPRPSAGQRRAAAGQVPAGADVAREEQHARRRHEGDLRGDQREEPVAGSYPQRHRHRGHGRSASQSNMLPTPRSRRRVVTWPAPRRLRRPRPAPARRTSRLHRVSTGCGNEPSSRHSTARAAPYARPTSRGDQVGDLAARPSASGSVQRAEEHPPEHRQHVPRAQEDAGRGHRRERRTRPPGVRSGRTARRASASR